MCQLNAGFWDVKKSGILAVTRQWLHRINLSTKPNEDNLPSFFDCLSIFFQTILRSFSDDTYSTDYRYQFNIITLTNTHSKATFRCLAFQRYSYIDSSLQTGSAHNPPIAMVMLTYTMDNAQFLIRLILLSEVKQYEYVQWIDFEIDVYWTMWLLDIEYTPDRWRVVHWRACVLKIINFRN